MGQFLEVIPLTTYHFPLNHLIGFADGSYLKLVMISREKGSILLILVGAVKKVKQRALVSDAVTNIRSPQNFHETTKQLKVTSTASM